MSWAAVIVGGSAIIGGVLSSQGAKSAANASAGASQAAIDEQKNQFDTLLSLTRGQRAIGNQALDTLGAVYGYSPDSQPLSFEEWSAQQPPPPPPPAQHHSGGLFGGGLLGSLLAPSPSNFIKAQFDPVGGVLGAIKDAKGNPVNPSDPGYLQAGYQQYLKNFKAPTMPSSPDYSAFYKSPDYNFRLNQGEQAVQNSAAAQGGLYSGNALRAISDYGQGTAAGEFGNWFNRQAALAGIGQAATSQAGQGALTTGANVGNLLVNQGNARASGIIDQTNSLTNMLNQLSKLYGTQYGVTPGG